MHGTNMKMANKIIYITYSFQWETNQAIKYSARVFKTIFKSSSFKISAISESNIYFVSKCLHVNEDVQKLRDWRFSQRSL